MIGDCASRLTILLEVDFNGLRLEVEVPQHDLACFLALVCMLVCRIHPCHVLYVYSRLCCTRHVVNHRFQSGVIHPHSWLVCIQTDRKHRLRIRRSG